MELPFFGKKKKPTKSDGRGYMPTDRSKELMGKGFSELDTIDVLRREGFSPNEIDKALTQVVKEGVVGDSGRVGNPMATEPAGPIVQPSTVPQDFDQAYQSFRQQKSTPTFSPRKETPKEEEPERREELELKLPTIEELQPVGGGIPAMPETALPEEYYQGYPTEEYIDYVVQERTQDVIERLNEFSYRNKDLENKLKDMNERVRELSKVRINEQQQVLNSIDGLGESINDVNIRMASLEKAFKETLPALIESVRALTDLVYRLKREA